MQPVLIDGCFGWLHAPATGGSETAVLICPALGREACVTHRALRLLADRLAAGGYATLRLDYPGCGESVDLAGPAPEAWLAAIRTAADRLVALSGATRIVVCGLRIGALLGMAATAGRADVAGLMLLGPQPSGRAQVREWLAAERFAHAAPEAGYLEADGCLLPRDVLDRLAGLDLGRMAPLPGQEVLLLAAGQSPAIAACVAAWRGGGAAVTTLPFDGLQPLLHKAFEHPPPLEDFDRAIGWLRDRHPARAADPSALPDPAPVLQGKDWAGEDWAGEDWVEQPFRFGPGQALVGTLTRPAGAAPRGLAVIIPNTAADPRAGFGRVGVELARCFAARGITALRIDFAGLGDSPSPGEVTTHTYETDRRADFRAAIDALAGQGYQRFALLGLCSGAYHALQAALVEPRVGRLLLVNQLVFQWRPGDQVEEVARVLSRRPANYLRAMAQPEAWVRLLKGRLGIGRVLRAQVAAAATRGLQWLRGGAPGAAGVQPRQMLEALAGRGVAVFVLLGAEDLSLSIWQAVLGPQGSKAPRGLVMRVEPGLDHVPTTRAMRLCVARILGDALQDDTLYAGKAADRATASAPAA